MVASQRRTRQFQDRFRFGTGHPNRAPQRRSVLGENGPMAWIATDPPSPLPPYWSAIPQRHDRGTKTPNRDKGGPRETQSPGMGQSACSHEQPSRCRVHGTVHPFFSFYLFPMSCFHTRVISLFFSSCSPGDCVSPTSEPQKNSTNYTPMPYKFDRAIGPTCGLSSIFLDSSKSFFFFFQLLPTPQGECWFPWKPIHHHVRISRFCMYHPILSIHKISSECDGIPYELANKNK